ncbi:MAG: hypothetical protein ABSC92_16065 [Rhizomicrobium sp.]|jgi:hypothetical protein
MFSLKRHFNTRLFPKAQRLDYGIKKRDTISVVSQMPALARRNPAMIAPSIWRRAGPHKNLHDHRGASPNGSRRARLRLRRIGITFWHRPFRAPLASIAPGGDFGGTP